MAERLVDRQGYEDADSDRHQAEPETAEEMQRPVPVAADERHGQEIQEATQVALDPVARAAVLSRTVIHGQLRDPEPAVMRQHRYEAMQLTVETEAAYDLHAICLQAAVHVVQTHAGEPARDGVEHAREDAPRERIAPPRLPARHEIEPLVELCEEARNLSRVVLEIAVERHDGVAVRLVETGAEGGRLAEVASQADDANVVVAAVQPRQRCERSVRRAVVDEDRFPVGSQRLERGSKLVVEERDAPLLVVSRDDDGDHGLSVPSVVPIVVAVGSVVGTTAVVGALVGAVVTL